jgi:hypothetical protein
MYSRFIFLEMVHLCVSAHLKMYRSKCFKMKRLGAPKVSSEGVGNPARMIALNVSVYVWDDILWGFSSLCLLMLVAGHRRQCFPSNF